MVRGHARQPRWPVLLFTFICTFAVCTGAKPTIEVLSEGQGHPSSPPLRVLSGVSGVRAPEVAAATGHPEPPSSAASSDGSRSGVVDPRRAAALQHPYHQRAYALLVKGDHPGVVRLLAEALDRGEEDIVNPALLGTPSLYHMLGYSLYNLGDIPAAAHAFTRAIARHPTAVGSWLNLGDCFLHTFHVPEAIWAFENAIIKHRLTKDVTKLHKARAWVCDWTDRDVLTGLILAGIKEDLAAGRMPRTSAADFYDVPPAMLRAVTAPIGAQYIVRNPGAFGVPVHGNTHLQRWGAIQGRTARPVIRIGFLSSDFGIHPVVTLIRGMLEVLHDSPTVLPYCYSLGSQRSWWSTNISESVEGFRDLTGMSRQDAARVIADDELDVLVDLNGHTLATGLPAMGLQPAPIQVSFLGYLATTATPFVNYVIGDRVGTPPTQAKYYSEKLALMPASFLVNDYPQLHGHVLELPRTSPHDAGITTQAGPRGRPPFVFASFSNYQKIDPAVFDVWMNVLRRVPNSVLWLIHHHAHQTAIEKLAAAAEQRGVSAARIVSTKKVAWVNHTLIKSAASLVLDTVLKNGHTSVADALWAGVPVISVRGERFGNRVAASLMQSAGAGMLEVSSLGEMEELATTLAQQSALLEAIRRRQEQRRTDAPLFNTTAWSSDFAATARAMVEVCSATDPVPVERAAHAGVCRAMHIFSPARESA